MVHLATKSLMSKASHLYASLHPRRLQSRRQTRLRKYIPVRPREYLSYNPLRPLLRYDCHRRGYQSHVAPLGDRPIRTGLYRTQVKESMKQIRGLVSPSPAYRRSTQDDQNSLHQDQVERVHLVSIANDLHRSFRAISVTWRPQAINDGSLLRKHCWCRLLDWTIRAWYLCRGLRPMSPMSRDHQSGHRGYRLQVLQGHRVHICTCGTSLGHVRHCLCRANIADNLHLRSPAQ